jgi:tRNA A37 threonylcarbamoyladenosine dehydratase
MSNSPINHNPDLQRLVAEGYELEIVADHLVVRNVPFVNAERQVRRGTLVSEVNNTSRTPGTHVIMFGGGIPCDKNGRPLERIINEKTRRAISEDLFIDCTFSSKPPQGYPDYYQKVTAYVAILQNEAQAIDPDATARTWRVIPNENTDSPFAYLDTASSRAGITAAGRKLRKDNVAILGLGGTGSYTLDLMAKTPAANIHLFDGDRFGQHNAFRSPGAPSLDQLRAIPFKVDHWAEIYGRMHRGIIPHRVSITAANVHLLHGMDFVFICADAGKDKEAIIAALEQQGIPFADTGMGLELVGATLHGMLTVTTSTPEKRDHVRKRVSFAGDGHENVYAQNIQVADLNMMSAAMAVIKYKKLCGFYEDLRHEHFTNYTIAGNSMISEDRT